MSSVVDETCTEKCRSLKHGQEICATGSNHSISDHDLLALWKSTCQNFYRIRDEFGRTALHISASSGRPKVVEWLIKREGSDINVKDSSGYTPLHRAVFFGHFDVARTLIKLGALSLVDNEGYFPLDLCQLDRPKWGSGDNEKHSVSEVFVWGNNENYNLGTGNEQIRTVPELLDRTKKLAWGYLGSCFIQVAMDKYHTVFLHLSSEVYSCGFGVGGRLGHDNEYTVFTPKRIDFGPSDRVVEVAVGLDHTLFRMENGTVKSCGCNDNLVLGHRHAVKKVLKPNYVDLPSTSQVIGISASKLHSVFMTKHELFVCGTNSNGQMGFDETVKNVMKPKKVLCPFETESPVLNPASCFTHVACNEYATVVAHSRGNICIFKKYSCITLNTRHFNISKIQVVGGGSTSNEADSCGGNSPLCIFILLHIGKLLIWRENHDQPVATTKKGNSPSQFTLTVFNAGRALSIRSMCASNSSLVLINQGGEAFKVPLNLGVQPLCMPNMHDTSSKLGNGKSEWGFLHKNSLRHCAGKDPFSNLPLEQLKSKRLPNIYNGLQAFCDPKGNNFAVTVLHQKANQTNLPVIKRTEINSDFGVLLKESSVEDDIHDIVFKVGKFQFPAHRFVIASTSHVLYKEVEKQLEQENSAKVSVNIVVKDVEPRVFEQILQFLYTNSCDILVCGRFPCYPNDPNWVDLMKIFSRKLQLRNLTDRLNNLRMQEGQIIHLRNDGPVSNLKFDKNSHKGLCDVDLVSEDGFTFPAHHCVVVSRLEYFKNMLQQNVWLEGTQSRPKLKFPGTKDVVEIFLDLMYRGECPQHGFTVKKDLDVLSHGLVASDLLLCPQFRSHFEYLLADHTNVENASEMLNLAEMCNADQLKESCMEFICLNVAQMLENRLLDVLSEETLKELGHFYRNVYSNIESRKLSSTSIPDDEVYQVAKEKFADTFELLDSIEEADFLTPKKSQSSKGRIKSRSSRTRTLSNSSGNELNLSSLSSNTYETESLSSPPQRNNNGVQEQFRIVSKHVKNFSLSPSAIQEDTITVPQTRKINIPIPNYTLKLGTLPSPSNSVTLNMSDFPSVEDSCSNSMMTKDTTNRIAQQPNSPNGIKSPLTKKLEIKSPNNVTNMNASPPMSSTSSGSKRKTKWKTLNEETMTHKVADVQINNEGKTSGRDLVNPWQKIAPVSTPHLSKHEISLNNLKFDDIVQHEKLKNENLQRAIAKPLYLSQIEDEAINQLWKRYNSRDVIEGYEMLQIERVGLADDYAVPVWRC